MLRTLISVGITLVLSLALLAACADDSDDANGIDDDPIGAADDSDTGPIEDDAAADDELVVDDDASTVDDDGASPTAEDGGAAISGEDEDALADDMDEHAAEEDDQAVEDDDEATEEDDQATGDDDSTTEDTDSAADGDTVEITLSEYEIEMDSTIAAGNITIEVTNDGDGLHGIAIQQVDENGNGDDEDAEGASGAYVASLTVAAGETEEREIELPAGEYVVFCPVGDHRDEGMETDLTVEE